MRMGDRLAALQRNRFVGRSAELELFRAALNRDAPDFAVLHIYGPGGMGKTTLLREFARLAAEAGHTPVTLDDRHLDASPAGFMAALQMALNLPPDRSALDTVVSMPQLVVFIDTYELIAPLDAWLRDAFLPQLPERALAVMAGRPLAHLLRAGVHPGSRRRTARPPLQHLPLSVRQGGRAAHGLAVAARGVWG